jgi:carboxyl-terminal processing protease
MKHRRRLLAPLAALALVACQRPHTCHAPCEAGLTASAPAATVEPEGESAQQVEKPADAAEPGALAPGEGVAVFDATWQEIHDTHFDPSFNGVDWDALKLELRPRAEAARTPADLRAVLDEMLARLGQSHFVVVPSDVLPNADAAPDASGGLGFDVRLRARELLVVALEPTGAAAAAGVEPGWRVVRLGTLVVAQTLAGFERAVDALGERALALQLWMAAQAQLLGPVGSRVTLELRDHAGVTHALELERRARAVTAHDLDGTLPTFYLAFESEILERAGKRVGRIAFSNWLLPVMEPLDAAVERMRGADGIVLDLRGNTGGLAAMSSGVGGHFFATATKLGTMLTRDSRLNIVAFPRRMNPAGELVEPFAGPLAIVIDETSASASEVFAGGMQAVGRARVFGATSAGAVLPAMVTRLPNGDTLMHALGDFETATGVRLERRGVVPDQPVELTAEALRAGRDPALEAAVDWILSAR